MNLSEITPVQAKQRLDAEPDTIYLDVRTVAEFEEGRPVGAWNIPVMMRDPVTGGMLLNERLAEVVEQNFKKHQPIIVGCRTGRRSARAGAIMLQAGYTNVVNMAGGFSGGHDEHGVLIQPGWKALGYPVESGDGGDRAYEALRNR